ncbi:hypothetical protein PR202_ga30396 [Eleusine coracana subsp. coracana]|uniref:Non-haem dioxygenase N-terminal domain-containing protein n=1 Tax=Eleusine coracana subsp. coracana TaxID=191504 RepID=A0AAV5DPA5_ELECO|nr:hypothetical protein PR202_ga30396 [Eleusine coracana subsp. coracana]
MSTTRGTAAYDRAAELHALDATLAGVRGLVASGATHVPRIFHLPDPPQETTTTTPPPARQETTVPVIDLGGADHAAVVDAVRRAASEWGFFQVTGHGVPLDAMAAAIAAARAFHDATAGRAANKGGSTRREGGQVTKCTSTVPSRPSRLARPRYRPHGPNPPESHTPRSGWHGAPHLFSEPYQLLVLLI